MSNVTVNLGERAYFEGYSFFGNKANTTRGDSSSLDQIRGLEGSKRSDDSDPTRSKGRNDKDLLVLFDPSRNAMISTGVTRADFDALRGAVDSGRGGTEIKHAAKILDTAGIGVEALNKARVSPEDAARLATALSERRISPEEAKAWVASHQENTLVASAVLKDVVSGQPGNETSRAAQQVMAELADGQGLLDACVDKWGPQLQGVMDTHLRSTGKADVADTLARVTTDRRSARANDPVVPQRALLHLMIAAANDPNTGARNVAMELLKSPFVMKDGPGCLSDKGIENLAKLAGSAPEIAFQLGKLDEKAASVGLQRGEGGFADHVLDVHTRMVEAGGPRSAEAARNFATRAVGTLIGHMPHEGDSLDTANAKKDIRTALAAGVELAHTNRFVPHSLAKLPATTWSEVIHMATNMSTEQLATAISEGSFEPGHGVNTDNLALLASFNDGDFDNLRAVFQQGGDQAKMVPGLAKLLLDIDVPDGAAANLVERLAKALPGGSAENEASAKALTDALKLCLQEPRLTPLLAGLDNDALKNVMAIGNGDVSRTAAAARITKAYPETGTHLKAIHDSLDSVDGKEKTNRSAALDTLLRICLLRDDTGGSARRLAGMLAGTITDQRGPREQGSISGHRDFVARAIVLGGKSADMMDALARLNLQEMRFAAEIAGDDPDLGMMVVRTLRNLCEPDAAPEDRRMADQVMGRLEQFAAAIRDPEDETQYIDDRFNRSLVLGSMASSLATCVKGGYITAEEITLLTRGDASPHDKETVAAALARSKPGSIRENLRKLIADSAVKGLSPGAIALAQIDEKFQEDVLALCGGNSALAINAFEMIQRLQAGDEPVSDEVIATTLGHVRSMAEGLREQGVDASGPVADLLALATQKVDTRPDSAGVIKTVGEDLVGLATELKTGQGVGNPHLTSVLRYMAATATQLVATESDGVGLAGGMLEAMGKFAQSVRTSGIRPVDHALTAQMARGIARLVEDGRLGIAGPLIGGAFANDLEGAARVKFAAKVADRLSRVPEDSPEAEQLMRLIRLANDGKLTKPELLDTYIKALDEGNEEKIAGAAAMITAEAHDPRFATLLSRLGDSGYKTKLLRLTAANPETAEKIHKFHETPIPRIIGSLGKYDNAAERILDICLADRTEERTLTASLLGLITSGRNEQLAFARELGRRFTETRFGDDPPLTGHFKDLDKLATDRAKLQADMDRGGLSYQDYKQRRDELSVTRKGLVNSQRDWRVTTLQRITQVGALDPELGTQLLSFYSNLVPTDRGAMNVVYGIAGAFLKAVEDGDATTVRNQLLAGLKAGPGPENAHPPAFERMLTLAKESNAIEIEAMKDQAKVMQEEHRAATRRIGQQMARMRQAFGGLGD